MKEIIFFRPLVFYRDDLIKQIEGIVFTEKAKGAFVWLKNINNTGKPYATTCGILDYDTASQYKNNLIENHGKIIGLPEIDGFLIIKVIQMEYCLKYIDYISTDDLLRFMTRYRQVNAYVEAPDKTITTLLRDDVTNFNVINFKRESLDFNRGVIDIFAVQRSKYGNFLQHVYYSEFRSPRYIPNI